MTMALKKRSEREIDRAITMSMGETTTIFIRDPGICATGIGTHDVRVSRNVAIRGPDIAWSHTRGVLL